MVEEHEIGDIIPEAMAIRRNMVYEKNARNHVCSARVPAPLLLDELYQRKIIGHDHHFYGVQLMTMRKLFLSPVQAKIGMFILRDEDGAPSKPIPMLDSDYLKVMRGIRSDTYRNLVREVCDEAVDPRSYERYVSNDLGDAFDRLVESVKALWENKKAEIEARERVGAGRLE